MKVRRWRVARWNEDKTLYVAEAKFWTEQGAINAANFMNKQFSVFSGPMSTFLGTKYFVATAGQCEAMKRVTVSECTTVITKKEK